FQQRFGLAPAVGLDQAGNDVAAFGLGGPRRGEHGVGLADARRCTEKYFEMPAALLLGERKQSFGRGSLSFLGGHVTFRRPDYGFDGLNTRRRSYLARKKSRRRLVSRFRSPYHSAARWFTSFGIGTLATNKW